jgi:Arc/MetJ-type ribon-helix-helix transcriptional regulator
LVPLWAREKQGKLRVIIRLRGELRVEAEVRESDRGEKARLEKGNFLREVRRTGRQSRMTIHLTPEQEQRAKAVIGRGAYASIEEVVDAGLAAVEQRIVPGFEGTQEELNALLVEGLGSTQLTEVEFWGGVNAQTESLLVDHKSGRRS